MEVYQTKKLAHHFMTKHDIISKGWKFELDNAKRRLGCCKYRTKTITFSKHYLPLVDILELTDTILHEIAHAIVGAGHGHDMVWQWKAKEIGCNGLRCYQGEKRVEGKYQAICPKCGKIHYKHRMTKSRAQHSCGACSGGRFNRECILIYKEVY